jgi:hypothetical protein
VAGTFCSSGLGDLQSPHPYPKKIQPIHQKAIRSQIQKVVIGTTENLRKLVAC